MFNQIENLGEFWSTTILMGVALSIDSFFANAANGVSIKKKKTLTIIIFSFIFAIAHIIMFSGGFFLGKSFYDFISSYSKYISFALLMFIGLKGLFEQIKEIHANAMIKKEQQVCFKADKYILQLKEKGLSSKEIKKILKRLGKGFMKEDISLMIKFGVHNFEEAKILGHYFKHVAKFHARDQLQELLSDEKVAKKEESKGKYIASLAIMITMQSIATSIDALATGFTYIQYNIGVAYISFGAMSGVVLVMCLTGGFIGKFVGERYERIANILSALVLIGLGIKALI